MPFSTLRHLFSRGSSEGVDTEVGAVSFLKSRFKSQNKSLSTAKTNEIEAKIVQHLARFASVPSDAVFDLMPPSRPTGLFADEVSHALSSNGPNVLSSTAPVTPLVLLYRAAFNPFNLLLTILAIISIATGDKATFSIMLLMVLISSGLRFWQEHKSVMKATRLVSMVSSTVRVLRHPGALIEAGKDVEDEYEIEIERSEVVPGDIVVVASGDMFPGDAVVLVSNSLLVGQSALTGEVLPVEKRPYSESSQPKVSSASDLISSSNICLAGTSVLSGSGRVLVVSTADNTYLASIAEVLRARRPLNAFQHGIRQVSYLLLGFMLVMTVIVLVIKGTTTGLWRDAFMFCISVAVGLTPELLPMIVTSNLALSAVRMSAKKVIVKQLEAILNLGGTTVLCCDKTGTLTQDRVVLHSAVDGDGQPCHIPLELAYLNAHFQMGTRSFLDAAILAASSDPGGDALTALPQGFTKVSEIPFDSTRRMLSVILAHASSAKSQREGLMITKGAAEEVLDRCTRIYDLPPSGNDVSKSPDEVPCYAPGAVSTGRPLDQAIRRSLASTAENLNMQGLRVIAVGFKPFIGLPSDVALEKDVEVVFEESDLVFVGFLAFLDPPKPDAAEAIERLKQLGVKVLVLTGDAPTVAAKVAMDIGIIPSNVPEKLGDGISDSSLPATNGVITGSALSAISGDKIKFHDAVVNNVIFAKLSPYMKLQIVEELRSQGENVAFLGDGVNDTMALRGADVGISVHSGTEVAKDAADVILLEKSLGVLADGVVLGRRTLVNTLKYIKMATSSNFGNVFSILSASAWLPYDPMSPLQLLVQNLLYDFSQGSIPWDNVDADTLNHPRNWDVKSIMRFMIFFGPTSSVFDICVFSLNWFKYGIRTIDSPLVKLAQTHWFLEGLLTQTLIVYFLRTGKIPFLQSSPSRSVLITTGMVVTVGISLTYIPKLNTTFRMVKPDPVFGGYLCAILVAYMLLVQGVKVIYVRLFNEMI